MHLGHACRNVSPEDGHFSADFPDSPPFISFSSKVSLIFIFLFIFLRNFFTKQKNSLRHSTDTFTRNLKCNLYFAATIIFSVSESPLLGVHLNMQMNVFIEFINISEVIETLKEAKGWQHANKRIQCKKMLIFGILEIIWLTAGAAIVFFDVKKRNFFVC